MKEFSGKVAVITGAASGIGQGIAERCAQEGMKVVLADVEAAALAKTEKALRATGATLLSVLADVSKASDVEMLAQKTVQTFGAVHLLVNNAGVVAGSTIWESTLADWEWVIGVNLWGVIHGLRAFLPIMLEQDTEAHIVNTASATGLVSYGLSAPYHLTKHGIVALSEQLYYSLRQRNAKVTVSVLCPAWVKTRVLNSARNRPSALHNTRRKKAVGSESVPIPAGKLRRALQAGMAPHEVAEQLFKAIESEQLYILPHFEETAPLVRQRMESILQGQNPPSENIEAFLFLNRD